MSDNYKYSDLTDKIINAFYKVYNVLGYGFLEKVYENAMMIELKKFGLSCNKQRPLSVYYDSLNIDEYFADITVNDLVIIELKAAEAPCYEHECQSVNYRKASDIDVGLLLNFGKEPEIKREVLTAEYKIHNKS